MSTTKRLCDRVWKAVEMSGLSQRSRAVVYSKLCGSGLEFSKENVFALIEDGVISTKLRNYSDGAHFELCNWVQVGTDLRFFKAWTVNSPFSNRTTNCIITALDDHGLGFSYDSIQTLVNKGILARGMNKQRNYGKTSHREVCKWLGIKFEWHLGAGGWRFDPYTGKLIIRGN